MKPRLIVLPLFAFCATQAFAGLTSINLGVAGEFAVLGGSTVTNTGPSILDGDLGVWAGTAITGFPPGTVSGTIDAGDALAMLAQQNLTTAYNTAAGGACPGGNNLSGQDLGGMTLTPGTYCFSSSAQLTGALTLNDLGNPNALFVFQIGSTLTTASASSVVFTNNLVDDNVFWQVGSSATLGTTTQFEGNILALASITLNTGADIGCGSALASSGAVTLDDNTINLGCDPGSSPEPGSASLLGLGLLLGAAVSACRLRSEKRPRDHIRSNDTQTSFSGSAEAGPSCSSAQKSPPKC